MTPKCPNCKRDQDDCVCVDEIEALRTQVAELKADAERYRWLREQSDTVQGAELDVCKRVGYDDYRPISMMLDTAIDAALAATKDTPCNTAKPI